MDNGPIPSYERDVLYGLRSKDPSPKTHPTLSDLVARLAKTTTDLSEIIQTLTGDLEPICEPNLPSPTEGGAQNQTAASRSSIITVMALQIAQIEGHIGQLRALRSRLSV